MTQKPIQKPIQNPGQNTLNFLNTPMISPNGFREYDARWLYPDDINLAGITALGLGLGTQMFNRGIPPVIAVGNDYRSYSAEVKNALILGLIRAGITVKDIGTALSPMAYFSQFHLDVPAVAMVTASHNPNGWTGVKMGFERPLTHGPEDMAELRDLVMNGKTKTRTGGAYEPIAGVREAYLNDLCGDFKLTRPLRVVCATGNGTASAFAPEALRRIGAEVVALHNELDYTFPHYNPNPEALEMLHDMARMVRESGADLAVGFDGDGDRCGFVDNNGDEIFADKAGLIFARDLSKRHKNACFVTDVKSTGLFETDPCLRENGARVDYWKTGHSHMKRRVKELGALAGFEKSGHYFLAEPIGRGYDCGLRVAIEMCKLLDRRAAVLSDLHGELAQSFNSPTLSPYCADDEKYQVLARIVHRLQAMFEAGDEFAGQSIHRIVCVNGARVILADGAWGLVRASSNTPNLVVVCESLKSDAQMREVFKALDAVIRTEPLVGEYDQGF